MASSKTVTASQLSQFAFCQESARLALVGTKQSAPAQQRMAEGEAVHTKWTESAQQEARATASGNMKWLVIAVLAALAVLWLVIG